jgi:type IV pilus assembly protein PilX
MKREQGSALALVLVVVVVLILGALAAIRSTETASLVAGNSAFKEATQQAADLGINAGFSYALALSDPEEAVANKYFPLRQKEDAYGLPKTIDWDEVSETTAQNYKIQFVVERLCTGTLPVTNTLSQCVTETAPAAGSNKLGAEVYESPPTTVFRVTVRTRGPKNSESYTQALMSR